MVLLANCILGTQFVVVIVTSTRHIDLQQSVTKSLQILFETQSYASTRGAHLLFAANQYSSRIT